MKNKERYLNFILTVQPPNFDFTTFEQESQKLFEHLIRNSKPDGTNRIIEFDNECDEVAAVYLELILCHFYHLRTFNRFGIPAKDEEVKSIGRQITNNMVNLIMFLRKSIERESVC